MSLITRRSFLSAPAAFGATAIAPHLVFAQAPRVLRDNNALVLQSIDRSGRQRMLAVRMSKAYAQLVNKTVTDRSQRIVNDSIASFSASLAELTRVANGTPAADAVADQTTAWPRFQRALQAAPTLATLREVLAAGDALLATAEAATSEFERLSAQATPRIVNVAGRQRMLSQRMARDYAVDIADGAAPTQDAAILSSRTQFMNGMTEMKAFRQNTAEVRQLIELIEAQWAFLDQGLRTRVENAVVGLAASEAVAKASENILEVCDRCTAAYARLAAS